MKLSLPKSWYENQAVIDQPAEIAVGTMSGSSYIQTYTGRRFDPLNPRPEDICIEDIAAALSKLCRFTGHIRKFYSVANHCINMSYLVPWEMRREALLHDASEAYFADMARPVKIHFLEYKEIETKIEAAIAECFQLTYPWPPEIKYFDSALLRIEAETLFRNPPLDDWHLSCPKTNFVIAPDLSPEYTEEEFLARWKEIN